MVFFQPQREDLTEFRETVRAVWLELWQDIGAIKPTNPPPILMYFI